MTNSKWATHINDRVPCNKKKTIYLALNVEIRACRVCIESLTGAAFHLHAFSCVISERFTTSALPLKPGDAQNVNTSRLRDHSVTVFLQTGSIFGVSWLLKD